MAIKWWQTRKMAREDQAQHMAKEILKKLGDGPEDDTRHYIMDQLEQYFQSEEVL
jgi:hypothetical protein